MERASSFTYKDIRAFSFKTKPLVGSSLAVYAYHIDGLLIDTGFPKAEKEVLKTLSSMSVDQILISHHHEDHSGNVDAVQRMFDSPVYASEQCIELMKSPPKVSPAQKSSWGQNRPYFNFTPVGQQIKTPKYTFDIIPIPGHAVDMVALHEKEQGWLFSADLYVYHRIKYFMRPESMKEQIHSIKRILELEFDQMFCSHSPQMDVPDVKNLLIKKLSFLEEFYNQAALFHQQGQSPKQIMKSMNLKETWGIRLFSLGALSTLNMVKSVVRDEAMS